MMCKPNWQVAAVASSFISATRWRLQPKLDFSTFVADEHAAKWR